MTPLSDSFLFKHICMPNGNVAFASQNKLGEFKIFQMPKFPLNQIIKIQGEKE